MKGRAKVVHVIHLRGGWETTPLLDGRYRHRRRFGRPRTLDPDEVVHLAGVPEEFSLNGEVLAATADIACRLLPRNELELIDGSPTPPNGVRLEISRHIPDHSAR